MIVFNYFRLKVFYCILVFMEYILEGCEVICLWNNFSGLGLIEWDIDCMGRKWDYVLESVYKNIWKSILGFVFVIVVVVVVNDVF